MTRNEGDGEMSDGTTALSGFVDRAHLVVWKWAEQRTLRRLRQRFPAEFRGVATVRERFEMDDAYEKLVVLPRAKKQGIDTSPPEDWPPRPYTVKACGWCMRPLEINATTCACGARFRD